MNHFNVNATCPNCKKKILVEGDLNLKLMPTAATSSKPEKQKKKATLKKKSIAKKRSSKKGKYDEDLKKLFKLNSGGALENIKLSSSETGSSEEAMKKMEDAAKRLKKDSKSKPSMEKKIQDWLSGGSNPFSE